MTDGRDAVTAEIPAGVELGEARLLDAAGKPLVAATIKGLVAHKPRRVEVTFFDRRACVALDGDEILTWDFPAAKDRPGVDLPVRVGGRGANLAVRHLKLFRDVYYRPARHAAPGKPCPLAADEYFMLGDNSNNSDDSRSWDEPAVPRKNFIGKPFLLHQPSSRTKWSVGGRDLEFQAIDWGRVRWIR